MCLPSLEAARITAHLLDEYKDEELIEDVLKPDYNFRTAEDILKEHFAQHTYSENLQDVVTEFFFKLIKHRKYLKLIMKEFLSQKSPWSIGSFDDSSLIMVIFYLLIIELNERTKPEVQKLLIGLNCKKAFAVVSVLRKPDTLAKLYEWGCQIWDVEYVKTVLKNVIDKALFQEVYEYFVIRKQKIKESRKKLLTVPVGPKCLDYCKRLVPQKNSWPCSQKLQTRIPIFIKASKVPSTTYTRPNLSEEIEKNRLKNREDAKKKYEDAQKMAFRAANVEKSKKFKEVIEKIQRERSETLVKKPYKKIVVKEPQYLHKNTATVILREGARILKLEQKEIKRYEDLASGGFNEDLLTEWEEEIREKTFQKHWEDIEKKHLEGLLSYEEAVLARQKFLKKKRERADEFRREKENWIMQLEVLRKEEQERIQESVEKGKTIGRGAKEAIEQVREEKHKIALEAMEESRALKERWLKEKEEDLQRKVQLIKEIKALQTLGALKKKEFNFTETANLGLLYEMSLAELKERLFILRMEFKEELEKRRAEIKMKKESRKEIIDSYQNLIDSHQKIVEEQKKRSAREYGENEMKKKREMVKCSPTLESLRQKLCERRRSRLNLEIFG